GARNPGGSVPRTRGRQPRTKGRRMDLRAIRIDPRYYQIAILGALLAYGAGALAFDISLPRALLLVGTALAAQYLCSIAWRRPVDLRSALLSGLSLCLLLRTNSPLLACAAAVVAIASKFAIRVGGKHVFNPTNFGIVVLMATSGQVWVSPGQWGNVAFFG